MHQLGLHELADALLGRARRRAGGQAAMLWSSLMTQYQRQGKLEQAAQIAMQILRSSRNSLAASNLARFAAALDADSARPAAMRVLAASGRLPQLIERTREQLKKTPNSVAIHQTLADYYTAARQPDQAALEMARIVELKPDDADLRLRLAIHLAAGGDTAAASAHYKAVFEKNPELAADVVFPVVQSFERAGKTAELIELLNGLDVKTLALVADTLHVNLLLWHRLIHRQATSPDALPQGLGRVPGHRRYMLVNRISRQTSGACPKCSTTPARASCPERHPLTSSVVVYFVPLASSPRADIAGRARPPRS